MVSTEYGSRRKAIAAVDDDSRPEFWVPRVREAHGRFEQSLRSSLSVAIELGRTLIDAKAKVGHGEFGRMFAGHADPVRDALPFVIRWGQKLMRLAENPAIANANHDSHLPPDLNAVHELALLKAGDLTTAIEDGRVTPTMTRKDARELRREIESEDEDRKPRARAPKPGSESSALADYDMLAESVEALVREFVESHPDFRTMAANMLTSIVRGLKS